MQSGRAVLWLIAGLVTASGSSYASNLLAHPSPDTVSATVMNFRKAPHAGGMKLVSSDIAQCYVDAKEAPQSVVDCMLWDISALNVDAIVRKDMIDRGVADPARPHPIKLGQLFRPAWTNGARLLLEARLRMRAHISEPHHPRSRTTLSNFRQTMWSKPIPGSWPLLPTMWLMLHLKMP